MAQPSKPYAIAMIGRCPFCRTKSAELWRDPLDHFHPYQVICRTCSARGPKCDCGWESAVIMWDSVRYVGSGETTHREHDPLGLDPHSTRERHSLPQNERE